MAAGRREVFSAFGRCGHVRPLVRPLRLAGRPVQGPRGRRRQGEHDAYHGEAHLDTCTLWGPRGSGGTMERRGESATCALAQEKRAQAGARHGAWAVAARPVARPGALAPTSVRLREHDVGASSPEWHAAATQHGLPMGAWTWQEVGLICNFASGELADASQARHTGSRAVGGREARRRGARPLGARMDDARLGRAQSGGTDRSVTVVYIAGAGRVREPAAGPRAVPHVP